MDLSTQERETLKVIDAEYTVEAGSKTSHPVVHLFCRDENRNRRQIQVKGFRPYFYIAHEEFQQRTQDVINDRHVIGVEANLVLDDWEHLFSDTDTELLQHSEVEKFYAEDEDTSDKTVGDVIAKELTSRAAGNTTIYHDPDVAMDLDGETGLTKIITIEPAHVGKIRSYFEKTWEADVPFERRFLISSEIHRGISIPSGANTVRYENWDGHSRSSRRVKEIRPADPPDVDPRMLVMDIEVATHGEGLPDPDSAPHEITAITAYDNYTDEYHGWLLESDEWDEELSEAEIEENVRKQLDIDLTEFEIGDHEGQMLENFNQWVNDREFDLLTGWNSNHFDYPYHVNRSYERSAYSIRDWSVFGNPGGWRDDRDNLNIKIDGRVTFDMLNAYDKTQFRDLESYSLEYVAQEELGMGKEEIDDDLDKAWHNSPIDFMTYNVRDVQAVVQIEQSRNLLDLYDNLRMVTGALYKTCNNNGPMIDTMFLRKAFEENIALTTNYAPDQGDYHGAHVFDPVPGKHENVVYPDLASLYPYILWTLNISPETMYRSKDAYRQDGYTDDDVFKAYIDEREWKQMSSGDTVEPSEIDESKYKGVHNEKGNRKKRKSVGFDGIFDPLQDEHPKSREEIYFLKPDVEEGFIRSTVDMLVNLKYEYKGQGDMYDAVKRVTNSLYGVLGDSASGGKGFRLFDWRLAEAITLTGQKVIQFTAEKYVDLINQYSVEEGYEPDTYLVGGDTDSVMTAIPQAPSYEKALEWAERASRAFLGDEDDPGHYDNFMHEEFDVKIGVDEHKMDVEIESLGSSLFFIQDEDNPDVGVKKRYAQHIIWDEDDGWLDTEDPDEGYPNAAEDPEDRSDLKHKANVSYDDYEDGGPLAEWGSPSDHVGITGFEYVRSDSATVTQESQQRVLTDILIADEPSDRIYTYVSELVEDIKSGSVPIEDLGRPKGIGNPLDDYGWKTTEELEADTKYSVTQKDRDDGGRYVATPGPTYRGRKYAVDHFTWEDGDQKKTIRFYVEKVRGDDYPAAYEYDAFPRKDRPDSPEVGRPVDAITVEHPDRIPENFVMDREKMMEKEVEDKLQPILLTIGEDWDGIVGEGRQVGLDQWA